VNNPQLHFTDDPQAITLKEVICFENTSLEGVLDRNDACLRSFLRDMSKDILKSLEREKLELVFEEFLRRLLAEGTALTLESNGFDFPQV